MLKTYISTNYVITQRNLCMHQFYHRHFIDKNVNKNKNCIVLTNVANLKTTGDHGGKSSRDLVKIWSHIFKYLTVYYIKKQYLYRRLLKSVVRYNIFLGFT